MPTIDNFYSEILAFALTAVGYAAQYALRPQVNLVWTQLHGFCYRLPGEESNTLVYTRSVLIQNLGKAAAGSVEAVFTFRPQNSAVWSPREYQTGSNVENHFVMKFPNLAPGEFFTINLLNTDMEPPDLLSLRCLEAVGYEIQIRPVRVLSRWILVLLQLLVFIGIGASIYAAVLLVRSLM
jgi:hypothetical protein